MSKRLILIAGVRDGIRSPQLGYFDPKKAVVEINRELDCERLGHFASILQVVTYFAILCDFAKPAVVAPPL